MTSSDSACGGQNSGCPAVLHQRPNDSQESEIGPASLLIKVKALFLLKALYSSGVCQIFIPESYKSQSMFVTFLANSFTYHR